MTSDEFSAALRELGLSQAEFSRRSGAVPQTVNAWAHGRLAVPQWADWVVALLRTRKAARDLLT